MPQAASSPVPPAPLAGPRPLGEVDLIRAPYVQSPATLAGTGSGLVLLAIIFAPLAEPWKVWGWFAAGAAIWLLRLAHYVRFRRHRRASEELLRAWRPSWVALVWAQAAMWGLAVWLFWGLGSQYQVLSLILIVYTYCLASIQVLASQPRVFLGFHSLVLLPTVLRVATATDQPWHLQLALILFVVFVITVLMSHSFGNTLGHVIRLKAHTDDLAARLKLEMAASEEARRVAEDARRVAEAASRAKTQFFAAASHDLRQPLHAMGLFAEALRQRAHDPEVASLVNSINESVDALEGLFGELLDITRIDTGGVEVNPAAVNLREMFARLRLHFEPVAFEKGLMLSFRGGQHVAHADPVLLERVLRNLVSNAIRYTDDGGVLVSGRVRKTAEGSKLLLQVWDSGIGISEASLPHIFDEFYQVNSSKPLAAHQRKGLGLGLAIVKRLAGLMESPLTVRSRVGHGTVFSLEVPVGRLPRNNPEAVPGGMRAPLGLTLAGRRILVLEDEAAVREGLVVVLQAWGAEVIAFETVDELEAWLPRAPAEPPHLLLVDYRLPQGRTGIDALKALRARWAGYKLPAIVITGSSLGGHEDEAVTHDYHLLIKPVLPNKLRAMIAFKLGVR